MPAVRAVEESVARTASAVKHDRDSDANVSNNEFSVK